MGRNAAFGRSPALERMRVWWQELDPAARTNALLAAGVGAVVLVILFAAVNRDASPATPAATVIRPPMQTPISGSPPTVVIDGLNAPGSPTTSTSAVTTTTVPSATTTATSPARTTTPSVATTAAPAPATTVTNPNVIFTDPPTTTLSTVVPTLPTSTAPPTTVAPVTSTTAAPLLPLPPLDLPRLLDP